MTWNLHQKKESCIKSDKNFTACIFSFVPGPDVTDEKGAEVHLRRQRHECPLSSKAGVSTHYTIPKYPDSNWRKTYIVNPFIQN